MDRALKFAAASVVLAGLVAGLGGVIAGTEGRSAVWLGAGLGLVIQWLLFVCLFMVALRGSPLLAHGLSMVARFLVLGVVAFFWVPWSGFAAAPLLFSLVAVFFGTTLLEPLFLIRFTTAR